MDRQRALCLTGRLHDVDFQQTKKILDNNVLFMKLDRSLASTMLHSLDNSLTVEMIVICDIG